jgi:hypothetical protein
MERKSNRDPRFAWIFASEDLQEARSAIHRKAVRRFLMGFKWEPGKARGLGLGFTLDELGRLMLLWRRAQWREGDLWVE